MPAPPGFRKPLVLRWGRRFRLPLGQIETLYSILQGVRRPLERGVGWLRYLGVSSHIRPSYDGIGSSSATLILNFSRWLAGGRPPAAACWRGDSPRLFRHRRHGRIARSATA